MKKAAQSITAALFVTLSSGASYGQGWCLFDCPPNDGKVRQAFNDVIINKLGTSNTRFETISFTVVERQDVTVQGVKGHVARVSYEVAFPDGYMTQCFNVEKQKNFWGAFLECNNAGAGALTGGIPPMRVGARDRGEGQIAFEKTSRGWVFQGRVY